MKKLLLYLLLLPSFVFGQINKKQMFYQLSSGSSAPSTNLASVSYTFKTVQYTDDLLDLVATPNVSVTNAAWQVRDMETDVLYGLAFGNSVSIPVTRSGLYKIVYSAVTGTDAVFNQTFDDILVLPPRFTEGEADIVIDTDDGNYYNDFATVDNTGLKILIKGTGAIAGYVELQELWGTTGSFENYARIQKEPGNTTVIQNGVAASCGLRLDGSRYVIFDGNNDDGTPGYEIKQPASGSFDVRMGDLPFTNVILTGIYTNRQGDVSGAAFSLIPPTSQTWNALTWRVNGMIITNNHIANSGDEGAYWGYTNDDVIAGAPNYQPVKFLNFVFAWNTIENTGRDGIQPCNSVEQRIHDNTVDGWGTNQEQYHEFGLSYNAGNSGLVYNNYFKNGKQLLNIDSGLTPYDLYASETTPRATKFFNNIFDNGTFPVGGPTETVSVYGQTRVGVAGTAELPWEFFNNTFITDKILAHVYFVSSGFTMPNFKFFNNIVVKETSTGGDFPELDYIGPGTKPSASDVVNNLVYDNGDEGPVLFNNVAGGDYRPSSLSSTAFSGSPSDLSALISGITLKDKDGFPSGDYFGAYSRYDLQTITPTVPDATAATFSSAVAVGSLTENGGTVSFEATKEGILYWVVFANDATAPTVAQVKAGGYLVSGSILDGGTAGTEVITGLSPSTAYDLYAVFTTKWWVDQAAVTKVDFTTTSDVVAPTLSGWEVTNAQRGRLYFNSSEVITATTYGGFTIDQILGTTVTVTGVTINTGSTTGHYLTLSENLEAIDYLARIAYSGSGSNLADGSSNVLATFAATTITNSITATRVNVNFTNYGTNAMGTGWNDIQMDGNVGVRTLDSDLVNSANSATGWSLAIYDNFDSENNATNATGIYITGNAGNRGLQHYAGSTAGLRIAGLSASQTGDIVYITKGLSGTAAGNININSAGGVNFVNAATEYKQSFTANGSGQVDILVTLTSAGGSSVGIPAFIITIY